MSTRLQLARRDTIRQGVLSIAPTLPAVAAFGVMFGAAAVASGFTPFNAFLMSALTFAGAAQFSAIELASQNGGIVSIAVAALAINARHIVMGGALQQRLAQYPKLRWLALAFLTDANWATYTAASREEETHISHLIAAGIAIWLVWIAATALGAVAGNRVDGLIDMGVDTLIVTFFIAMLMGSRAGRGTLVTLIAAAAASLVSEWLWPGYQSLGGILAGAIVGYFTYTDE